MQGLKTGTGIFVTGTDTGVGKTLIAAGLLRAFAAAGMRAVGMKPVASGTSASWTLHPNEDVELLVEASNVPAPLHLVNPYCFDPPIAPHLAAAQAARPISLQHLQECYRSLQGIADVVVVEGAGGLLVPLGPRETWVELALALELPVLLVVGMRLGCLNHALLTAEALRSRNLEFNGWIANRIDPAMQMFEENVDTLRALLPAPLLGIVPHDPGAGSVGRVLDFGKLRLPKA